MRRTAETRRLAAIKERNAARLIVIERFGQEAIGERLRRLCTNCQHKGCHILPITTEGEDCPYFIQRGKKG